MKLSTFPRRASALLVCTTALALADEPALAQAQADAERVAGTWIAETVRQATPASVRVEAGPSSSGGPASKYRTSARSKTSCAVFGGDGRPGLQLPRSGGETGFRIGSGFVIYADGLVATASDLVAGSDAVEVTFDDGTRHEATLVGSDPESAIGRSEAFGTTAWTGRLAAIDAAGERLLIDEPPWPSRKRGPARAVAGKRADPGRGRACRCSGH